jgi:hypothetical protein
MEKQKHRGLSLYWKCQLVGWSVASLYWGYIGSQGIPFSFPLFLIYFLSDVVAYILITHLYRNFALHNGWHRLNLQQLIIRLIPAVVTLGLVYLVVTSGKIYLLRLWLSELPPGSFRDFFIQNWTGLLMAGIRLMSIWVLAYHLYHYSQREANIARENARLALISKDAQLNNLSAQLNPHFFFNSLNTIKCLVIENPEQARRAIDLLSDLLRNALYSRDDKLITLEEEIQLVKDYLELEKLRLEERLRIKIDANENIMQYKLPPLSIQTLVENAIKHGIDKKKEGGLIELSIKREHQHMEISIQNPGKLLMKEDNAGLGLKNLEERLALQFNGNAVFKIMEIPEGNILATISIPVK